MGITRDKSTILRLRDGARKLLIRRGTDCSNQLNTSGNGFTLELFWGKHSGGVNKNGGLYISQPPKTSCMAGWWLNQPIWKKYARQHDESSSPIFGVNIKKCLKPPPKWYIYLHDPPLKLPSFEGKSLSVSG